MGASDPLIGRTIAGKFLVEGPIGSGAMGAVYRARQVALEKTVAIKVLHGEHANQAAFVARFQREAKAASRMNHPNSMQVLDFGQEPDGLLYIAMEYLNGRSLHRVLREDPRPSSERITDVLMQTLAALGAAHDMGVIHRDLKPENIVILKGADDDGRTRDIVKVCDFGIAKVMDSRAYSGSESAPQSAPVTTAGLLVGTPEYMSPEQARGETLDARSDIYAVGVILFELLTGRAPFLAESAIGVLLKHITMPAPRPSTMIADVDPRLEAICLRAMMKDPAERYPSARDMRAELRGITVGLAAPVISSPMLPLERPDVANASTLAGLPGAPAFVSTDGRKPTLDGTAVSVPGRTRATVWVAFLSLVSALVATLVVVHFVRQKTKSAGAGGPSPSETAPPFIVSELPPPDDSIPSLEPTPIGAASSMVRGTHTASEAPSTASSPRGSHSAGLAPSVASVAPLPPSPPALQPPPAPPPPEADPTFDPNHGYVTVGMINAQGVREAAIHGAVQNVGLSACYRTALRARGERVNGYASLSFSIDENGKTRSVIATGAEFLPGLSRCLQGMAYSVAVAKSQVDSGGGTADVNLTFNP